MLGRRYFLSASLAPFALLVSKEASAGISAIVALSPALAQSSFMGTQVYAEDRFPTLNSPRPANNGLGGKKESAFAKFGRVAAAGEGLPCRGVARIGKAATTGRACR